MVVLFLLLIFTQGGKVSYEEAMEKCMEQVEVSEFYLENGQKGKAFRNFDINCLLGAQIPNFTTHTLEGRKISTADLKGKVNVFNFWFGVCQPCLAEIPGLNSIAEKYRDKNVNFLALSVDQDEDMKGYVEQHDFRFTHLLNGKEVIRKTFQHKSGFPTTIITDSDLQIIEIIVGGKSDSTAVGEVVQKLEALLDPLVD